MKRQDHASASSLQPWARILIAAALLLALSLLAAASLPLAAPAMSPGSALVEAEASDEDGEEAETEEEFEAAHSVALPAECILRSAQPSVAVQLGPDNVSLTLRYATEEPTRASVDYWLKGGKGTLQLGSTSRHLGAHGVVHLSSHLDEREMAKVRAARTFLVSLDIPEAPSYCARYLTLRLTAKHQLAKRETWSLPL